MSIVDVARAARVSVSTVSRVINHLPGVSVETEARVRAVMQNLGYVPPAPEHRRGPKPGRSGGLASGALVLLVDPAYGECAEVAFLLPRIQAGLQEGAAEHGAILCVGSAADPQASLRGASSFPVRAVLVLEGSASCETLAEVSGVPVVQLLTPPPGRSGTCDVVSQGNAGIGRHAAEYLLARGHERLCVLSTAACWPAAAERAMAFAACGRLARRDVLLLEAPKCGRDWEGDLSGLCQIRRAEAWDELARSFLRLSPRPTGLFVTSDAAVSVVYRVLTGAGLVIGKDVDVVSCNNDREALAAATPRPLTYDLQGYAIGRLAVDIAAARAADTFRLPALRVDMPAVPVPPA